MHSTAKQDVQRAPPPKPFGSPSGALSNRSMRAMETAASRAIWVCASAAAAISPMPDCSEGGARGG